jgi:hypothetical protein
MARCAYTGCYDRDQANVCWYPRGLVRVTTICKGPDGAGVLANPSSPLCLQSVQNPTCLSNPGGRAASPNGYVWCYWNNGATIYTGWVPGGDIGGAVAGGCTGPAGADFACGSTPVGCNDTVGCADRDDGWHMFRDAYIRYAPGSTAYYWVASGANVVRKGYSANNDYACVVVTQNGKYCPDGTVGWVEQSALSR